MKNKVLAVIKPMYASKGLNKEELESLAEIASKNLNESSTDEDIKNVADGLSPYVDVMQKVGNRMVTSATEKYKGYKSYEDYKRLEDEIAKLKSMQQEPPKQPPVGVSPEEVQKLIADALAPYREKEEKERLSSLLNNNEKLKLIPEVFKSRYSLEKEDELEATVTKIENDWAALKQEGYRSGAFIEAPSTSTSSIDDDIEMLKKINSK